MSLLIVTALQLRVLHIVTCSHPELNLLKHFSTQTVQTLSPYLFFQRCVFIKASSTSERLGFTLREAHENLAIRFHWSWIGPWHTDQGCMQLLQHSFDKHSFGWRGTVNVHIKLNSQIEC